MDLLQLIYGVMLLATGMAAFPAPAATRPWAWWGLAGIVAGLAQFSAVFRPEHHWMGTCKGLLVATSGLLLVEGARRLWGLRPAWAIHGGLVILTAGLAFPLGIEIAAACGCALPGFAVTTIAWWRLRRQAGSRTERWCHILVALVFGAWTLSIATAVLSGRTQQLCLQQSWYLYVLTSLSLLLFLGFLGAIMAALPGALAQRRRRLAVASTIVICLTLGSVAWLAEANSQRARLAAATAAETDCRAVATYLEAQDATGSLAARLIAEWDSTSRALAADGPRTALDAQLAAWARQQGLALAYVLNPAGVVVCSSNRGQDDDLVGHGFAWRPYFQAARAGGFGYQWATGAVTSKRGIYHSAPVRDQSGAIIGVAAIKQDAANIDRFLAQYQHCLVLDPEKAVFSSSPGAPKPPTPGTDEFEADQRRYLVRSTASGQAPWGVLMLHDLTAIGHERRLILAAGVCLALLLLAAQAVMAVQLDRRHALGALADQLQRVFEANRDAYWDWDIRAGTTYFSDSWFTMLGWSPGDLPHSFDTWLELLHPDDREAAVARVQTAVSDGSPYILAFRLRRQDGGWTWIESRGKVVATGPDGKAVRMAGTHTDITARRQAEERLQVALARAEEGTRAKSTFLANMSHEIRTPMNGVLGMTELLLETPLDETQAGYARTILRSGQGLLTLLNDVLDLSRIEAGRLRLEQSSFDLHLLINDLATLYRARLDPARVVLQTELDPTTPRWMLGDQDRLRQVLGNLLGNAVKFTNDGSITIRVWVSEGRLRIAIRDTGIGIPVESQAALFSPFTQADASTTRRYGGSGLGLAICRELCGLMGGSVGLSSAAGEGTTCTVDLPFAAGTPLLEHAAAPVVAAPSAQGITVLLAEDQATNQEIARLMLQRLGAIPVLANDGAQALALLAERNFDLVLMDCHMPVLDGYEATRELRRREHGTGRRTPIIAMTANALAGDRDRCLEAGMDDYLAKPVAFASLATVLSRWTGHRPNANKPSSDSDPCLDPGIVADLHQLASPQTVAILAAFIAELPGRIQGIATAFANNDLAEVHTRIHALKGTAGCLGAVGMQAALAQIDAAAQAGEHDQAWRLWRQAQPVIIASSAAFRGLAASLQAGTRA